MFFYMTWRWSALEGLSFPHSCADGDLNLYPWQPLERLTEDPLYMNVEERTNGRQAVEQTKKETKMSREVTNVGIFQLNVNGNEVGDGQDGEGRGLRGE